MEEEKQSRKVKNITATNFEKDSRYFSTFLVEIASTSHALVFPIKIICDENHELSGKLVVTTSVVVDHDFDQENNASACTHACI